MLNTKDTNRKFFYANHLDDYDSPDHEYYEVEPNEANLVSSLCEDGLHRPALDLDLPGEIFQSSTPGHVHLYLDKPMTWPVYVNLLFALSTAGVLEPNYVTHCIRQGMSLLRLPHIKKKT